MVRVGCHDCEGCSVCCQDMGNSLVLDPMDIYQMTIHLKQSFEQLLSGFVALDVVDGIVLPHMQMEGQTNRCAFLNDEGRCSIHSFRPGICRLFPLGRIYEDFIYRLMRAAAIFTASLRIGSSILVIRWG